MERLPVHIITVIKIDCGHAVKGFNQCDLKKNLLLFIILSHVQISMAKGQMHLMQFKDDKEG